jgi:hypothetical protein
MARKLVGPTGSRRRRWLFLCTAIAAIAMAVIIIPSALAVHDLSFQLDGDVSTHAYTTPNANQVYDWGNNSAGNTSSPLTGSNGLFNVTDTGNTTTGTEAVTNNPALVPVGTTGCAATDTCAFATAAFVRDFRSGSGCTLNSLNTTFCTSDTSTYATGSKDTLGVANGGWQCNKDNNVNSKIDIMNAYAASYFTGSPAQTGDHNIYFGLEKNKDNGVNDVGVWLLQGTATCNKTTGGSGQNFSGTGHQNKDVLVVSEFSNGGGVSNIKAYEWAASTDSTSKFFGDGGCIDSNDWPDPNNPNPANGLKGCNGLPIFSSNADCKVAGGGPTDVLCATTNAKCADTTLACGKQWNDTVATPWLTSDATLGVGKNQIVSPDFFEGGINITKLFGSAGQTAPSCFATVVPDTRSSASITATLFDFVTAQLGECHSSTVTSPVDAATAGTANEGPPASSIPVDPADAAVTVKDKTTVTVTGVSPFAGHISWHICGPTDSGSTQLCDGTTGNVGVDAGGQNITTSGTYYSPTVTVTSAGRYCFRAEFSSTTTGVPPSSDSRANECFTVAPVQPTLTTDATDGPVAFGQPISDTVSLLGTAHKPGSGGPTGSNGTINPTTLGLDATGDIVVTAFGPNSCSTTAFTSSAIAASGDGTYGGSGTAFEFTPSSPGQYIFVASYAGDSPNTLGIAASACLAAPDAEKVTVQQISTSVKTKQNWIPNDTATVSASSGNLAAGGTVRFRLYLNSATCQGTAVYDQSVTLTGGNPTEEVSTTNTGSGAGSLKITTGYTDTAASVKGPYSWLVEYTPAAADTAHLPSSSACNAENFSITYTNDPGP